MKGPRFSPPFLPAGDSTIGVSMGEPIDPSRYKGMGRDEMLADLRNEIVKQTEIAERTKRK
jgi:hypothetical protein